MTLNDLFAQLSYGELSNLALSNKGNGTIRKEDKPRIVHYANEALTRIYARFILSEKDLLLALHTSITNYHFDSSYAMSNECAKLAYIMDLPNEPFQNDVLKVLSVHDQAGYKVPLNDAEQLRSVYTPRPTVLQVPHAESGKILSVLYQANHLKLSVDYPDQEIYIPDVLASALRCYIAYLTYSHMSTRTSVATAQENLALYSLICDDADENDLVNSSISTTNTRFELNGWT